MKFKDIKYLIGIMMLSLPMTIVNASTISDSEQLMSQLMTATDAVSITDSTKIQLYMEATGQTYDPNVIEVIYIPGENLEEDRSPLADFLDSELYVKNFSTYPAVRHDQILDTRKAPAGGELKIDRNYKCYNRVDLDIYSESAWDLVSEFLGATYNYDLKGSETVSCGFRKTYSYAVQANVYPIFTVRKGEVWDKDVLSDDHDADFLLEQATGTSVSISKL